MRQFTENQKLSYLGIFLVIVYLGVTLVLLLAPSGENQQEMILAFVIQSVVFIPMIWIAFTSVLQLEVGFNYLEFKFPPFVKKRRFEPSDIAEIKVIKYGFVGGWGIRLLTKYGTVYNTWGNKGLFIKLKSGKKMLIGTQRAEELERFLASSTAFGE